MRIYTWEEAVDEGHVNCILSDHHGIYIPQEFITTFPGWTCISEENKKTLKNGPDSEAYWEAWEEVLAGARYIYLERVEWRLHQDGDLFAVDTNIEIDFETFH